MKPRIHSELIKQWADGAEIQFYGNFTHVWTDTQTPSWRDDYRYRVKPNITVDVANFLQKKLHFSDNYEFSLLIAERLTEKYNITPKESE